MGKTLLTLGTSHEFLTLETMVNKSMTPKNMQLITANLRFFILPPKLLGTIQFLNANFFVHPFNPDCAIPASR